MRVRSWRTLKASRVASGESATSAYSAGLVVMRSGADCQASDSGFTVTRQMLCASAERPSKYRKRAERDQTNRSSVTCSSSSSSANADAAGDSNDDLLSIGAVTNAHCLRSRRPAIETRFASGNHPTCGASNCPSRSGRTAVRLLPSRFTTTAALLTLRSIEARSRMREPSGDQRGKNPNEAIRCACPPADGIT